MHSQSENNSPRNVEICVSLVSHGHGRDVAALIMALAELRSPEIAQVIVTVNIPEPDLVHTLKATQWPFVLHILENAAPKGFGANHNGAAVCCTEPLFCVLNPDVGIRGNPFPALVDALSKPGAGCAYPLQVSEDGVVQVSAREVPTPGALIQRYWRRVRGLQQRPQQVHWATAACLLFRTDVYRALGGFDERYFMYCEDVDICIRLQLLGYSLVPGDARVIHVATAASHRNARHLAWHLRSLVRLWGSSAYREFLARRRVSG